MRDEITQVPNSSQDPASQLTLMRFYAVNGKGNKNIGCIAYEDPV